MLIFRNLLHILSDSILVWSKRSYKAELQGLDPHMCCSGACLRFPRLAPLTTQQHPHPIPSQHIIRL